MNVAFRTVNQFPESALALFALGDNAVNYDSAGCPNSLGCRVFLSLAHDT